MNIHVGNFLKYITPLLGVILSLPTLLICMIAWSLAAYEVMIQDTKGTLLLSVWNRFSASLFAWFVLYVVFGPLFTCVLCTIQLARLGDEEKAVNQSNSHTYCLTRAILVFAAVSICLLILTGGITRIIRGPT